MFEAIIIIISVAAIITVAIIVRAMWDPFYCCFMTTADIGVLSSSSLIKISPSVYISEHFINSGNSAKWARSIIAHCDAMRDEIDLMHDNLKGNLQMGAMPSMSPVMPLLIMHMRKRHPDVRADVRFVGIEAMTLGLNNFTLDVAISYLNDDSLCHLNKMPIYVEKLSLLVTDNDKFRDRTSITWREAAELPLAMLRGSMHERKFVDETFKKIGCDPIVRVESESIVHLMFQTQYSNLATIIPGHFTLMPGLHPGTKALNLIEPVVSQEVGLIWGDADPVRPMASAMVATVKEVKDSGELETYLGEFAMTETGTSLNRSAPRRDSRLKRRADSVPSR